MSHLADFTHASPSTLSTERRWPAWWLPVLAAGGILLAAYAGSPNFRFSQTRLEGPYAGDFLQEWLGGHIVLRGDHHRFYDPDYAHALQHDPRLVGFSFPAERYLPIVYPPFYYLLVSPLSLLSVRFAAGVWAVLMTGCFLATAVWLGHDAARRLGRARPGQARHRLVAALPWLLPAALLYQPLLESLTSDQKGTLCLLLFTATFLLFDRGRPLAAGLVFGLLAFKPQLTLVIGAALLLKGQWRFVLGGAATGAILVLISLAMGPDICRQYFGFATGTADYLGTAGYALEKSHCLYGFFALLCGGPGPAARVATLISGLAVVSLLVGLLRQPLRPGTRQWPVQFSGLLVATILLSPHLLTYDLTMLLLPLLLLGVTLVTDRDVPPRLRTWLIAALALLFVLPGISVPIASSVAIQLTVPLLVVLLALLVITQRHDADRGFAVSGAFRQEVPRQAHQSP